MNGSEGEGPLVCLPPRLTALPPFIMLLPLSSIPLFLNLDRQRQVVGVPINLPPEAIVSIDHMDGASPKTPHTYSQGLQPSLLARKALHLISPTPDGCAAADLIFIGTGATSGHEPHARTSGSRMSSLTLANAWDYGVATLLFLS